MPDPRIPVGELERFGKELKRLHDRIDTLAAPSGTQQYQAVAKLTALVNDIQTQLNNFIANDSYTKAQINARITNPGLVGNVSTSASARFNGGLASTDVYSRSVTYGGPYTATWTHQDGTMGTAPSSERFKTDIEPARLDVGALERAEVVTYRYRDAVANLGDEAATVLGVIAEQMIDAGLGHAVTYDAEGQPFTVEDRPLLYTLLAGYQALATRVAGLESATSGRLGI